jgi:5'-nucleotidase (lipoprotein e(P4) family)
MKKTYFLSLVVAFGILSSCCHKTPAPSKSDEESLLAILYQQKAGEYRALCLQAYRLAKMQVDSALNKNPTETNYAVITDLDETVLDNSAQEGWIYEQNTTASLQSLETWWLKGKAKAVPGSVEFFQYLKKRKVDIYYISNRSASLQYIKATMVNMDTLKYPYTDFPADTTHFLFQQGSVASKEPRRLKVIDTLKKNVIVYLGDNLIDLDKAFDKSADGYQNSEQRLRKVDSLKSTWGVKYIVFPNAIYGDWESAFYSKYLIDHKGANLTQEQKNKIRKKLLNSSY